MVIQTDYSKVDSILIAYPLGYKNEFSELTLFYDKLISKIPIDINIIAIVNNKSAQEQLKIKFGYRALEIIVINGWDDIWIRDIIGIGIEHSIAQPIYDATYCNYIAKNRNFKLINSAAEDLIKNVLRKGIVKVPLKIDGGNLILNSKYAFITQKVITDNNSLSEDEITSLLHEKLGIMPIIVPTNKGDSLGHIDGYMSFINDDCIAIAEYPKMEIFKADNEYSNILHKYCQKLNLRIVTIQERPVNQTIPCECDLKGKRKFCTYTAVGNYINFLRINNTIILPEYTLPSLKETMMYNNLNEETLSYLGFQVIKINCDTLAQHGGSLRCLSYTCRLN